MSCKHNIQLLLKPIPITEQNWPEGTVPLVSICCITYNHEKFIRECLDGFLMQETTFPVEILIHDDASTDKSANIIREYESEYPNLMKPIYQVENQYSKEVKINWTFNFPRAKGKYIALCEGDDYWNDSLKLQKQVVFLEANKLFAGCFHDTYLLNNEELTRWRDYNKIDFTIIDTFSTNALFHTSSFVFRKSFYYTPEWISNIVSGDMALFSIIASKGKIRRIPGFMSVYRKHLGGVTESAEIKNNFHQKRIELMRYLNEEFSGKYYDKIIKVISFHQNQIKLKNSIINFFRQMIPIRKYVRQIINR